MRYSSFNKQNSIYQPIELAASLSHPSARSCHKQTGMTTATTTPIPPHSSNVSSSLTAATPSSNSPGQMLRDNWQQNVESGGHGSEHSAPPSDPPVALPSFPPQSTAPSSYYLPSSPNEMFLASYPSLGPDANRKPTKMTEYEKVRRWAIFFLNNSIFLLNNTGRERKKGAE